MTMFIFFLAAIFPPDTMMIMHSAHIWILTNNVIIVHIRGT